MKKFLFAMLLSSTLVLASAAPQAKPEIKPTEPAKTDAEKAKLPDVDADTLKALKDAVIEGQAIQLQLNDLEKAYRQLASQANENAAQRGQIIADGCKKAKLDEKTCDINLTPKGVANFVIKPKVEEKK